MNRSDKKKRVATALLDLTERDVLSWEQVDPDAGPLSDSPDVAEDGFAYVALHDEMDLLLYPKKGAAPNGDVRAGLRVNDPESGVGWAFPDLDEIEDLYEFVQFRVSGLEAWMDGVLEKADDGFEADAPGDVEGAPLDEETVNQTAEDDVDDFNSSETLDDVAADAEVEGTPSEDFPEDSRDDAQDDGVFGGGGKEGSSEEERSESVL